MSELQNFTNPAFGTLRTVSIDGEPYFVGKDVADILGYSNTKDALSSHVDEEDKRLFQRSEIATLDGYVPKHAANFDLSNIPNRGLTIINESGLYSLVLSSKLPKAKEFKRWVTSEVLPSIRKHGAYATPATLENLISDPEFGIKLLTELKKEQDANKALKLENTQLIAQAEADKPKVIFADAVSTAHTEILIGDLAKILKANGYSTGQKRLFQTLRDEGYLIKQEGMSYNMPTQRSMDLGLMRVKETAITHSDGHVSISKTTKITGKGQVYFVNRYCSEKTDGYLPKMEQGS